jgi:hypothetical protein
MHDRKDDGRAAGHAEHRGGEGQGGDGPRRDRGGPPDSAFLDLEISKVLYGEASGLAREAARELMKDVIKQRLKERLGDKLEAIARLAADDIADDVEANLDIEARIAERGAARKSAEARLKEAIAGRKE